MSASILHRSAWSEAAASNRARPGVVQKACAALTVLVGLTFIAMTLIVNLFSVGPAFERLTDGFRPVMTQQSVAVARADIGQLAAAGNELQTALLPALAAQLKMTPAQLNTMLSAQYPSFALGLKSIPQVVPGFNGLITTIDQQRPYFASADAIPTNNLPATTLPWGLLAAGVLAAGLGIYMWFAPRIGAVAAVVLGAVLVAGPLMLSLPQKASNADRLNANLKPVYTQTLITQSNASLATLSAMGTQMQTQMLPALATQMKATPAQFQALLAQNFPATATALKQMPTTLNRFQGLVGTFRAHLSDYNTLRPVSLAPIVWVTIGCGIALMLLGGLGTWTSRRTAGVPAAAVGR